MSGMSWLGPSRHLIAVAVLALLLGACDPGGYTVEEHYERALGYIEEDEPRSAAIELRNVLQRDSEHAEARRLLGEMQLRIGNAAEAEKELQRAMDLGVPAVNVAPSLAQALIQQRRHAALKDPLPGEDEVGAADGAMIKAFRARAHIADGDLESAAELLRAAQDLDETAPSLHLAQAMLALAQDDRGAARHWTEQALEADPAYGEAWSFLGSLERRENRHAEAVEAYSQAIEHKANNTEDLLNRAILHAGLGNLEEAREDQKQAARRAPEHPYTYYAEGLIHFAEGNYAEAQVPLQQAVRDYRDFMEATFYLGVTNYALGNDEQARRHLSRFQRRVPLAAESARLLAILRIRDNDLAGARAVLEPVVEAGRADDAALRLMAHINMAQADHERGLEYLRQIAEQSPESAADQARLGMSLMMAGDETAGFEALETAVDLDPEHADARAMLISLYLRAGRHEEALAEAERALLVRPDVANLHNLRAGALMAQGDHEQARRSLERALDLNPGFPPAAHNLAMLALQDGRRDEAIDYYQTALEAYPDHMMTRLRLAHLRVQDGDVDGAKEHLRHAAAAHPDALQPRLLLARHEVDAGDGESALEWLEPVAEDYAGHPGLLSVTGEALFALERYEESVYELNKLISRQPESFRAHHLMALAYAELGNLDQAETALAQALEINPDHVGARLTQVRVVARQGRTAEAYELASEMIDEFPDAADLHAERAWLAAELGRDQQAVEGYRSALEQQPRSIWVVALASTLWRQGEFETGVQELESWLEDHPNDARVRLQLANAYLEIDEDEAAREAYRQVLADAPDNVIALNNLAWLMREEDPDQAREYAERAVELAPEAAAVLDTLGNILIHQGEYHRAEEVFVRAARVDPGNPSLRYQLARAYAGGGQEARARALLDDLLAEHDGFDEREAAVELREQL